MADLDHYSTSDAAAAAKDSTESDLESKLDLSEDEKTLIIRMYNLVGVRWSIIAGRIPGRTAEEIKKYLTSTCVHTSQ